MILWDVMVGDLGLVVIIGAGCFARVTAQSFAVAGWLLRVELVLVGLAVYGTGDVVFGLLM